MTGEARQIRQCGRFRLDAGKKILWAGDEPVRLQPKEIELLCVLTEFGGEVVTKDELLRRVWADVHVEESNLTRHIYQIRKTFREYGESADLIKTVPRRGYRFTGSADAVTGELVWERQTTTRTIIEEIDEPQTAVFRSFNRRSVIRMSIAAAVVLILLTTVFALYFQARSAGAHGVESVAVLPLRSLDDDEGRALGQGFADALITSLGKIDGVRVISARTVSRYAESQLEPADVGRQLGVDAIFEGTLQRSGGKVRVTLRLVRVADGRQIWARSFDEADAHVFALQDRLASETADALALSISDRNRPKPPTNDLEAYRLYLQGQYFFRRRETSKGGGFFRKAVERDPKFAEAWAGLAAVYAMGDSMPEAEATVNRALVIAPDLAEAHAVRGMIRMFLEWDWADAEKSLVRAIELDRNSVEAHHWYGTLMTIRRRFPEAERSLQRALELDPTSANLTADLGLVYLYSGQYEKAEATFLRAGAIDPRFAGNRLRELYETQGRDGEAIDAVATMRCIAAEADAKAKCEADARGEMKSGGMRGILETELNYAVKSLADAETPRGGIATAAYTAALAQARLGRNDEAVRSLNHALESKLRYETANFTIPFIAAEPRFAGLKENGAFIDILRRLNLD